MSFMTINRACDQKHPAINKKPRSTRRVPIGDQSYHQTKNGMPQDLQHAACPAAPVACEASAFSLQQPFP